MPKRASHTFESEADGLARTKAAQPFYCLACGQLVLTSDVPLNNLPQRRTDHARVLMRRPDAREGLETFRLKATRGEAITLRRSDATFEKQYRYLCNGCALPVAYACVDSHTPELTYIFDGALGTLSDFYLEMRSLPLSFSAASPTSCSVALLASFSQSSNAITSIDDAAVAVSLSAPAESATNSANAEMLNLVAHLLHLPIAQLSLTRGQSTSSMTLHVDGLSARDAFRCLHPAVESFVLPLVSRDVIADTGPEFGRGVLGDDCFAGDHIASASKLVHEHWEKAEAAAEPSAGAPIRKVARGCD